MGTQSRTGLETRGWPQSSISGVDLSGTAFTTDLLYRALAVTDSSEAVDLSVSLATEILLREVDAQQHALAEGPCIDALLHPDTVRSNDLSIDDGGPIGAPGSPRTRVVGPQPSEGRRAYIAERTSRK